MLFEGFVDCMIGAEVVKFDTVGASGSGCGVGGEGARVRWWQMVDGYIVVVDGSHVAEIVVRHGQNKVAVTAGTLCGLVGGRVGVKLSLDGAEGLIRWFGGEVAESREDRDGE